MTWSASDIEKAIAIVRKHHDRHEAAAEVAKALGRSTTISSLDNVFRRAGKGKLSTYLLRKVEVVHPVARHEEAEARKRERREFDEIVKELRDARLRLAFLDRLDGLRGPPKIHPKEKKSGIREMTAVALASDWHVEEPVDPVAVAGRNAYDLTIAERRIKRFFDGIIWNIEHHRASKRIAIRSLVLWLGGDLMTGYIHQELVESNELSPTETIRWLLPKLRDGIASVLQHTGLDEVVIPCSYGNHGRTTDKTRIATGAQNSYEYLMYHVLAESFADDGRVRFEITASPHQFVDVYDWVLHFHHGDSIRYAGGVGGIAIPLLKALPAWESVRRADIHNIGHFHTLLDFGRAVVNGSLIGYGPYSQHIKAPFEIPQQALYFIDSRRGKCLSTKLWVDDEAPIKEGER